VANIGYLLITSFVSDFFDHGREIIFSVFWERKVPKLSIIVRIEVQMLATVLVASQITQPGVVTGINSNKRWSF